MREHRSGPAHCGTTKEPGAIPMQRVGETPRLQKHHGSCRHLRLDLLATDCETGIFIFLLLRYQVHEHLFWKLWDADMLAHHITSQNKAEPGLVSSSSPHLLCPVPSVTSVVGDCLALLSPLTQFLSSPFQLP